MRAGERGKQSCVVYVPWLDTLHNRKRGNEIDSKLNNNKCSSIRKCTIKSGQKLPSLKIMFQNRPHFRCCISNNRTFDNNMCSFTQLRLILVKELVQIGD